jgi:hypothetical protein
MTIRKFHEIFALEVAAISERRKTHGRGEISLDTEDTQRDGTPVLRPTAGSKVVGLSLSGGGIRSSAFCLGVLQALDAHRLIEKIDYLSSVSGGGYIATSMTAAMSTGTSGKFPFASELREDEVPGVQHIRDHSNYLFPQGVLNLFTNIVVYLRGLVANAILLLPALLFAAAFTIWCNPDVASLRRTELAGVTLNRSIAPISVPHFGVTLNMLLWFLGLLALWALWRSLRWSDHASELGRGGRVFGIALFAVLVVAFCEFQPLVLDGMFKQAHTPAGAAPGSLLASWLKSLAAIFAPLAAVIGFLGRYLADFLKQSGEKPGFRAFATRLIVKLAMYIAGAAVPLVLWMAYLYLSFWAIRDPDCVNLPPQFQSCPYQAPEWLIAASAAIGQAGLLWLYLIAGAVLFAFGLMLSPNANSLHRLYRDRLSKAFLFDPSRREEQRGLFGTKKATSATTHPPLHNTDLLPLDTLKISALKPNLAPYHLINTSLNIEGSKYANRRGRNADFFIFSPLFTGSEATGYVTTKDLEERAKAVTVATAMAISGAAASSNMGSATIKPLTPTLAILNIRLGYWLINPAAVAGKLATSAFAEFLDKLYFVKESFGRLSEDKGLVYLTDGGHVENLGIYELLRRRCKLIIAVDAEADPDMSFGALVTLERYARIDLGVRVDLPWAAVRDVANKASVDIAKTGGVPPLEAPRGPHCALGTIYYPWKEGDKDESDNTGVLLYVKSALTGDENDYIVDYKRRYSAFPHETTADQLFSEEQFEVYRALGFHALYEAFKFRDEVSMRPKPARWQGRDSTDPLERRMREILDLPLTPAPAS